MRKRTIVCLPASGIRKKPGSEFLVIILENSLLNNWCIEYIMYTLDSEKEGEKFIG